MNGDDSEKRKGPETDPEVVSGQVESAKDVEKTLKGAEGKTDVTGVEVVNPQQAYKNLETALKMVRKYFKFDAKDLYFKQFPGDVAGESVDGKVQVDPIFLMHPAVRLAHIITHEVAHQGGEIENEALVEAFVQAIGFADDGLKLTDEYNMALENFYIFVEEVADGRETEEVVSEIYNLYYNGDYEAIYEMYEKKYMSKLKTDEDKNHAFEFFESVFPELEVETGRFGTKELVNRAMANVEEE